MPRLVALQRAGVISLRAQKKLVGAGIQTVEDLLWLTSGGCASVIDRANMTEEELKEVLTCLTRHFAPLPRQAIEIYQEWKRKDSILKSGCTALDSLLSGEVTEFAGPPASGKTQICLSLAAHVSRDLEGTVAYLDSSQSLCPLRLQTLCTRSSGREDEEEKEFEEERAAAEALAAMQRVRRFAVPDPEALLHQLSELEERLQEAGRGEPQAGGAFYRRLRLVVVDSVGSLLSSVVGGQSAHGHSLLVGAGEKLQALAAGHGLAVLVANHTVRASRSGSGGAARSHALGATWAHLPTVSVTLLRVDEELRRAVVRKSNKSRTAHSAAFALLAEGLADVDA